MAWAPDYVSLPELKAYVGLSDTVDDIVMCFAISAASRAIDHDANRQFGVVAAPEQRTYRARPDYELGQWTVDVDDYQTATGLVVEVVDAGTVTTFVREPFNAAQKGRPWTRVTFTDDSEFQPSTHPHEVAVTAVWGWTAVPTTVKQATLLQASRFFSRRHSPYGVAGSPELGSEIRLLARVDPDVGVALRDHKRQRTVR
jgi:hypothetical protein